LVKGGISEDKIAQVVGLSSSVLFDQDDPLNPTNRRISILVLNDRSAERIARQQQGSTRDTTEKKPKNELPEDSEFQREDIESLDIEIDDSPLQTEPSAFDQIRKTLDDQLDAAPQESDLNNGINSDEEFF